MKDYNNILLKQYEECYNCFRHHNRVIWQIPLLFFILTGTVIVGAFSFIDIVTIRLLLLWFSACVAYVLYLALIKHHYYYEIELETLCRIEDELNIKRVKRKTFEEDRDKYWAVDYHSEENVPKHLVDFFKFFEKQGSHVAFLLGGFITFFIILLVAIINTVAAICSVLIS